MKIKKIASLSVMAGLMLTAAPIAAASATEGAAPSSAVTSSAPVKQFVDRNSKNDGVKGTFTNRTDAPLKITFDQFSRESKFTVQPGEFFTYVQGNDVTYQCHAATVIRVENEAGKYLSQVRLYDPNFERPASDINFDTKLSHDEGETNRADQAPLDVSVKREADGNRGIHGENGGHTEDWANFDVYVDDFDARYTSFEATVANRTKDVVKVRAFQAGNPAGGMITLQAGATHEFTFSGKNNTVKLYNPAVSQTRPVGELAYQCDTRQSACSVKSTFASASQQKVVTISDELGVNDKAHLDAKESATYVERSEPRDPSQRADDTGRLTFELHRIATLYW